MSDISSKMKQWQQVVEAALDRLFPLTDQPWNLVDEACRYSLLAGGKRLRPILVLALSEAIEEGSLKADQDYVKPGEEGRLLLAGAIEMIHTYSLIHDDLPAMDNDDLRRGRATNHVVYGEAVAILSGDALLNRAYELLFEMAVLEGGRGAKAGLEVARLAGKNGMIGGQILDITWSGGTAVPAAAAASAAAEQGARGGARAAVGQSGLNKEPATEDDLQLLQSLKTGALLRTPLVGAARLYGLDQTLCQDLDHLGDLLGRAFQIQDDLLDVEAKGEVLGKTTGKDARDQKLTYVTLLGLAGARQRLEGVTADLHRAIEHLADEGLKMNFFSSLVTYLNERSF